MHLKNHIIATDGVSEPVILIHNKWVSLIDLNFVCSCCNTKIDYSNKDAFKYPNIWDVKI